MTSTGPAGAAVHRRVLIAAALAATLLTACGDDEPTEPGDDPRALTSEEAELLSLTRFRLHQQETVPVEMEWPGTPATELDVTLDLHAGLAWGRMESDGAERFILWDSKALGTAPLGDDLPAADEWSTRRLTTEVPQDIFMMLALTLGADRPENPVLLQQNSARFLRHDEVDGTRVTVMEGPRPAQGAMRASPARATGSTTRAICSGSSPTSVTGPVSWQR
ncbi:hypothetical protein [Nocardioides alcanivorans]|uniref:hypothetical protein n=1 Tax=Nocardioides alcanivorans TaxID=2897352 RepID=UPI001F205751|nr:hypothetical protein [Nocardioides alcanivorans]